MADRHFDNVGHYGGLGPDSDPDGGGALRSKEMPSLGFGYGLGVIDYDNGLCSVSGSSCVLDGSDCPTSETCEAKGLNYVWMLVR